jgi:hypothetical protein
MALGGRFLVGLLDLLVDLAGRRLVAGDLFLSAAHLHITTAIARGCSGSQLLSPDPPIAD